MYVNKTKNLVKDGIISYEIHNDSYTVVDESPARIDPFEFKVCGFGNQSASPITSLEGLCTLFDAVFVFLGKLLALDNFELLNELSHVKGIMNSLYSILKDHIKRNVAPAGVYGLQLLELADKNKFIEGLQKKEDQNLARILHRISLL